MNFAFEINTQKLADREFSVGLSFNAVCARYPDSFADLTLVGNHCIDQASFGATAKALRECVDAKLERLLKLKEEGKISDAVWEKQTEKAMDDVCIPEDRISAAMGVEFDANGLANIEECIGHQLSTLRSLADAGEISGETWERSTISVLNMPCRSASLQPPALQSVTSVFRGLQ